MSSWPFTHGLHDLGNGCYAWLQPDGTWGWSNAGLVESRGHTLLVDTLMGLDLTRYMLEEMRRAVPAAKHIEKLVNTHANPDHCMGNQLLTDAEIIGTHETAEEMKEMDMKQLAGAAKDWQKLGDFGEFFYNTMGRQFEFEGVMMVPPTTLFDQRLDVTVGDKSVQLVKLGPAHTAGDTIAYVVEDRIVYTGDILFNKGHPIVWAGPVRNWIAACDYILGLDVEIVVPGHGPLTDQTSVQDLKDYLQYVSIEARKRYDAGMDFENAACDIPLNEYKDWTDAERIVANVYALYCEFGAKLQPASVPVIFGAMNRYRKRILRSTH